MKPLLFSISAYDYLKDKLLQSPDIENGMVIRQQFPDGERYLRLEQSVTRRDVLLLGGTINDSATLELFDMANAIIKYGALSLTLIVPYFGFSTMERAVQYGEVVTAKTRALLLSAIPKAPMGNRIMLFDLHSEGLPHYFEGGIQPMHIYCKSLVQKAANSIGGDDFVLASTDAGRAKWVESLANDMGVGAAFVFKQRMSGDTTRITAISADVVDKKVIIYDDMIRTGGSLIDAAKAYRAAGAASISVLTTHGLFVNNGFDRLRDSSLFERVFATDSHPNAMEIQDDLLQIQSIAPLILERI